MLRLYDILYANLSNQEGPVQLNKMQPMPKDTSQTAKTLVIGGSGFIGRHLVDHLRNDPFFGNVSAPTKTDLNLLDRKGTVNYLESQRPTAIVNLSGFATIRDVDRLDLFALNTISVVNLVDSLSSTNLSPRVITCSSAYVYSSENQYPLNEATPLQPQNLYAVSKAAAEMAVRVMETKSKITIARIFNTVGVGQKPEFLIPRLISFVKSRKFPIPLKNLSDKRDFIDVRDLCQMFSLVLKSTAPPSVVNFSNGFAISIYEVIEALEKVTGHLIPVLTNSVDTKMSKMTGDNSRLISLGYKQKYRLEDTLAWMLDQC